MTTTEQTGKNQRSRPVAPASLDFRPVRRTQVTVDLVTDQLGGGPEPKTGRPKDWLKSAAVRGAVRYWWRAIFGSTFDTVAAMRQAESAIFGGPAVTRDETVRGPGKVALKVLITRKPKQAELRLSQGNPGSVAYFPGSGLGGPASKILEGGSASATITMSEVPVRKRGRGLVISDVQWEQASKALAAFVLFGGSGSRTRKTAGAIVLSSDTHDEHSLDVPSTQESLATWLSGIPRRAPNFNMFSLGKANFFISRHSTPDPNQAQKALLEMWRDFRQDRPHPPSWKGAEGWGRSRWPEPDALRIIHDTYLVDGSRTHKPNPRNAGKAPRAHLGLPIVVKFKGDTQPKHGSRLSSLEPRKTELGERYASPVLLTLVRLEARYHGLVIVTPSLLPDNFKVTLSNSTEVLKPGPWDSVRRRLDKALQAHDFTPILREKP